ncbi:MAG: hypothetical protein LBU98_02335 [Alistipes sp.]|jgi:hypothetical protein|nr:hypothetical protein [Alistipes sp.]
MKKKIILLGGAFVVAIAVAIAVYANSSVRTAQVMLSSVEALSQNESSGSDLKNQVVGCGSYSFHDWAAGCCQGYSGCSFTNCPDAICN